MRLVTEALEARLLLSGAAVAKPLPLADLFGRSASGSTWIAGSTEQSFVNEDGLTPQVWNGAIGLDVADGELHSGDFNGDGLTDLAHLSTANGRWQVWLANGQGFQAPAVWEAWPTADSWTDPLVGDFNGDGLDDVAARSGTGEWMVGLSDGGRFVSQVFDKWSTNVGWLDVQTADVNGDGLADIIGRATTGTWVASVSSGASFTRQAFGAWSTNVTWHDVRVADINGDGFDDVIGRASNGRWVAGISDSTRFTLRSLGAWSTNVTWHNVAIGDFNGDGRDDVIARASTGTWVAGLSNGSELKTIAVGGWSNSVSWHNITPGDFNGDGLLDVAGRDQHGRWWVALSNGSRFINAHWGKWFAGTTWDNVLVGNFIKAEDDTRERAHKLEQVVLGLYAYHNEFRQFPVDNVPGLLGTNGKPLLSWRVHILPFLGYDDLYRQFRLNEPWNSAHNLTLLDQMPELYRTRGMEAGTNRTGFRLFEGNGAYDYDPQGGPKLQDAWKEAHQTLFVIETMPQNTAFWTRPEDIVFRPDLPLSGLTRPTDFFLAATLDRTIRKVNPFASASNSAAATTWNGGEVLTHAQLSNVFLDWAAEDSRATSLNKLKTIGLALDFFHDSFSRFPPGYDVSQRFDPATGLPYLSWRVHLLPYLGYYDLYQQFRLNEPWDSPHNIQLLDKMPEEFRSRGLAPGGTTSAFKLITGPEAYALTYFPNSSQSGGPRYIDFWDGRSSTISVIELTPDKAVPWTQWNEVVYSPANPLAGIGPIPMDGLHVVMWDQTTRTIAPTATPANFGIFATTNQREVFTPTQSSNVFFDWPLVESLQGQRHKLQAVGLAMHNFHNMTNQFPPLGGPDNFDPITGLPNLSWRVHILPYLGYGALYDQFRINEAWDSPHNIQLLNKMPEVFRTRGVPADAPLTAFKLFVGDEAYSMESGGPRSSDLRDEASGTIMAIELLASQAVEWTRPDGDISFDPANPLAGVGTIPPGGLRVVMFDGSVKTISPSATPENFSAFVTFDGGEIFGPAETSNVFLDWQRPEFPGGPYYPGWLAADSTYRKNNLRGVVLALHHYRDIFSRFPVAFQPSWFDPDTGLPYLSWRVHLLPYLGYGYVDLYQQFRLDEPWDSPHNIQLLDKMPEIFRSRGLPADSTKTGFQLFVGNGAYFFSNQSKSVLGGPRISDITDGTFRTIAVIETMPEDAVEWTRPDGDIAWNPDDPYGGLTIPTDFFLVAMFDGSVRTLHPMLDEETFRAFVTFAGGEPITYSY
ncbi:MAG: DUF1559 domain-containing protein [Planctomycetaceae bacterium]|nr:DUF1559 domain-containing protein [Planctomycetaceae bacterium]